MKRCFMQWTMPWKNEILVRIILSAFGTNEIDSYKGRHNSSCCIILKCNENVIFAEYSFHFTNLATSQVGKHLRKLRNLIWSDSKLMYAITVKVVRDAKSFYFIRRIQQNQNGMNYVNLSHQNSYVWNSAVKKELKSLRLQFLCSKQKR